MDIAIHLLPTLIARTGVGIYKAEARRVEHEVGRDYDLSDGQGYHVGLEKRFKFNDYVAWSLYSSYRLITYSSVKIKDTTGDYIPLTDRWRQKILSVGVGFHISIPDVLDESGLGKRQ